MAIKKGGMAGHESPKMGTDVWLTPPEIIAALGVFDLDPCSPVNRPWDTARRHYTKEEDGLAQPWEGRVWMNPPYGREMGRWMERLAEHGDGIALVFARTETAAFFNHVWPKATAILFLKGRLCFYTPSGEKYPTNAGAPSVLIAYGDRNADALKTSGIEGAFVRLT